MERQFDTARRLLLCGLIALTSLFGLPALSETRLVMAEENGCYWCAKWNEEIAHIYPKTAEGQAAPLHRMDINDQSSVDLTFNRPVRFTPTFILVQDGHEIARIEGYPGEDFFWGLLQTMLDDAQISYSQKAKS